MPSKTITRRGRKAAASTPAVGTPKRIHTITLLDELTSLDEKPFISTFCDNCTSIYNYSDKQIESVFPNRKFKLLKDLLNDLTDLAARVAPENVTPETGARKTRDIVINRINELGRIIGTATQTKISSEGKENKEETISHKLDPSAPTFVVGSSNETNDELPVPNNALDALLEGDTELADTLFNSTTTPIFINLEDTDIQTGSKLEQLLTTILIEQETAKKTRATSDELINKMQKEIKSMKDIIKGPHLITEGVCNTCLQTIAPHVPSTALPAAAPISNNQVTQPSITVTGSLPL